MALLSLFLIVSGILAAPMWDALVGGPITKAYFAGLIVTAFGFVLLVREMLRALRTRGRKSEKARLLLVVACFSFGYLALEFAAGFIILILDIRIDLFEFRRRQRYETQRFKLAHPFLILSNNPEFEGINKQGFVDRDWPMEKAEGTIRIACIGGSTNEDGFPQLLNEELSRRLNGAKIEVLNFGTAGWTTAQSLINYALTVKYYRPDYLLIHDAANENKVRGYPEFRTDYSHAFTILRDPPPHKDAFLVRYFNSYALGKFIYYKWKNINPGVDVFEVIAKPKEPPAELSDWELEPFKENLGEIITMARAHGTRVILTTMPSSRTNAAWGEGFFTHMTQANEALRALAAERHAPLIELAQPMDGHEDYFLDPVHLNPEAVKIKVGLLADALTPILEAAPLN